MCIFSPGDEGRTMNHLKTNPAGIVSKVLSTTKYKCAIGQERAV